MTSTRQLRLIAVAVSVLLWGASLYMPAIVLQKVHTEYEGTYSREVAGDLDVNRGMQMLGYSIFGPLEFNFAGFANLLLIPGWVLMVQWKPRPQHVVGQWTPPEYGYRGSGVVPFWIPGRRRPVTAGILFGVALLLSMQTLQLHFTPIEYDESGGNHGYLYALLPGWYAWVLSIALPFLVSLLRTEMQPAVTDQDLVPSE